MAYYYNMCYMVNDSYYYNMCYMVNDSLLL